MNRSGLLPSVPLFRRAAAFLRENTRLREAAFSALAGFALSAARLMGHCTPMAACLCVATGKRSCALFSALGALAGYLLFCGEEALAWLALTGLMLCASALLRPTALGAKRAFFPMLAGACAALLGGVLLLSTRVTVSALALLSAQSLLAGLSVAFLREDVQKSRRARLFAASALTAAAAGFGLPFEAGLFCAAALCAFGGTVPSAVAAGAVLDLCCGYGGRATAALALPALLFPAREQGSRPLRLAAQMILPVCVFAALGGTGLSRLAIYFAGTLAGEGLRGFFPQRAQTSGATRALQEAAELLETLACQLPAGAKDDLHEADEVFDGAAERVCRCCPQFTRCWKEDARQTCQTLLAAAERILPRGVARAEDFSERFRADCLHFDGFLTAVDQELETMLRRRRYRAQTEEYRRILAREYRDTADFLRSAQEDSSARAVQAHFAPEIGIDSAGKAGASGDGVCCFSGADGAYYVVLCDAMGSGAQAAELCAESLRFLRRLLTAGFAPEAALRQLNGLYLLRENGCFATVDLLRVNLSDGSATLCKWGAAASYLRTAQGAVQRLGTQSLPPGLDDACTPQTSEFSLAGGAVLVMASDGAQRARLVRVLEEHTRLSVRMLARKIVRASAAQDDTTVVALRLRAAEE